MRSWPRAAFAAFLVGLVALLPRPAAAYPWMVSHGYTACAQCHVDPTGAGTLTAYGRAQSEILLRTPAGEARATLAIPGLHNVRNALAAAACAHAAGVPPAAIGEGLTRFRPYSGRLQVKRTAAGATLIDDSYNANPDSVRAAIDVLAGCEAPTALVLGDMGEVGAQGPAFHAEVGRYAKERGVGRLVAFGEAARESAAAFGGRHLGDLEGLEAELAGVRTILVKGSRFMKMERVVQRLTGEKGGAH